MLPKPKASLSISTLMCVAAFAMSGCGTDKQLTPEPPGTVAPLTEDLPVCTGSGAPVVPGPGGTPDPRSDMQHKGRVLEKYHLNANVPATPRDQFFLALIKDDARALGGLLYGGADVNIARGGSFTIADDGTVSFLDDAHAEQNTALHWAAELSYSGETIRLLIARGADLRAKDSQGRTALMKAAANEYLAPAGLQALITAGADVRERDNAKMDALLHAVSTPNRDHAVLCAMEQKLGMLRAAGADINENASYTPLMQALSVRNLGIAKLVHALGGDLRARAAADRGTALHVVAQALDDSVETVKWLLSRGIELHARNTADKTALELFQENLAQGRCYRTLPARPHANACAQGVSEIIRLIEQHRSAKKK
jgi:ankyrin repeat protein